MKLNEVQQFKIDHNKRKNCKLVDDKGKKVDTYSIQKNPNYDSPNGFQFEANLLSDSMTPHDKLLGYARCEAAYIETMHVYGKEKDVVKARGCGIGSTLATLCMLDEVVNNGDVISDSNLIRYFGSSVSAAWVSARIKEVKKECTKGSIGIFMHDAERDGNAYFAAARKSGYKRIIIFDNVEKLKWSSIDVTEAQKCFNEGKLQTRDSFYWFSKEHWFFCRGPRSRKICEPCSCSLSKR